MVIAPVALAFALTIPVGPGLITVEVNGLPFELHTYKPKAYKAERMILVFHGVLRNADVYRDHSIQMGDKFRALVIVPKFDEVRFPSAKYQLGGLLSGNQIAPQGQWTWSLIPKIAAEVKKIERAPEMPYYLIGHSAGGQFVMRMAGFIDSGAERIVSSNPGSDLFPTRDMPYPYGFGGLPQELSNDEAIRRYLAQPMSIYLGGMDVIHDQYFGRGELPNRQGDTRRERGENCYALGKKIAEERGWKFNWTLHHAIGVGHDHEQMFNHPVCELALFGEYVTKQRNSSVHKPRPSSPES